MNAVDKYQIQRSLTICTYLVIKDSIATKSCSISIDSSNLNSFKRILGFTCFLASHSNASHFEFFLATHFTHPSEIYSSKNDRSDGLKKYINSSSMIGCLPKNVFSAIVKTM